MTAFLSSGRSGFVMALVIPPAISIAMKVALIVSRSGKPKETLLAPQTVLQPSSSPIHRRMSSTARPAVLTAPTGMTSGSISTSSRGMPYRSARSTMRFATSNRTFGSMLMPDSSLEIAMTGTPYSATRGNTFSMRSSSPVTELMRGRPPAAFKPATSAPGTEESMQRGRSTTD